MGGAPRELCPGESSAAAGIEGRCVAVGLPAGGIRMLPASLGRFRDVRKHEGVFLIPGL